MDYQEYIQYRNRVLQWLEPRLNEHRMVHTLGVEFLGVMLARKFDEDYQLASLSALLHDNAKYLPIEKQLAICKANFPKKMELTMEYASVLHAFAGAVCAKEAFPDLGEEVYNAICYHTTGRPDMSGIEKIIYLADYAEPSRPLFEGIEQARSIIREDLDEGMRFVLTQTSNYVQMRGKKVHPLTTRTLSYYQIDFAKSSNKRSK